jgi:uroporphyrin-III C-methyltransferase
MAGRRIVETATRLLTLGMAPDTPLVAMENVSLPGQRIWHATLATAHLAPPFGEAPVVLLVGAALAPALHSMQAPPWALAA